MKNKVKIFLFLIVINVIISSCSITLPHTATNNSVGTKVGISSATGYLGFMFFDQDASILTAAKKAGITKISTIDIKHTSYFNLVVTYETIVTGE